jgi:citrate synthase
MQGPKLLFESEDNWITAMGAWFPKEGRVVFRGRDLFRDLKDLSWIALLIFAITGRIVGEKQLRLFEGMWTLCTSYPEPRIWNNRVAALTGTARSTPGLALGAANAVSEASIYGRRPGVRAIDFLIRAKNHVDEQLDLEELVRMELEKYKRIYGYGRPITLADERITPLMALAEELGFSEGPHVKIAFAIEHILLKHRNNLRMNIASLLAALAADQGMSPSEYHRFMALSFSVGIAACYIDAVEQPEGSFFPLRCERIAYIGKPKRQWENR